MVSAFAHATIMELDGVDSLREYLGQVVSVTTDQGVEAGLPSFRHTSLRSCFPPWLQEGLNSAEFTLLIGDDDDPPKDTFWQSPKAFMESALQIPGALHILDNLQKDLAGALGHWATHVKNLKVLQPLFREQHYRERLQWTCLQGHAGCGNTLVLAPPKPLSLV